MRQPRRAFSLVELLVVIGIIGIMIGLLMPTLHRVRQQAIVIQCASNLRQIHQAFSQYLIESRGACFWRGGDIDTEGMDWYCYGGRETGNTDKIQQNLFNRIIPRPLNKYVHGSINVFRCPEDNEAWPWTEDSICSEFEWVGNSYNFNAVGFPTKALPRLGGLSGIKITQVRSSSMTILFHEACMVYQYAWHGKNKGNFCMVDGHVDFIEMPPQGGQYNWQDELPPSN